MMLGVMELIFHLRSFLTSEGRGATVKKSTKKTSIITTIKIEVRTDDGYFNNLFWKNTSKKPQTQKSGSLVY